MATILELREQRAALAEKAKSAIEKVKAEKRDLSDNEKTEIDGWIGEAEKLGNVIKAMEGDEARSGRLDGLLKELNESTGRQTRSAETQVTTPPAIDQRTGLPNKIKRFGKLRTFKSPETAYRAAQFYRAMSGNAAAKQWCKEHGVDLTLDTSEERTMQGSVNTKGGFLVPDEFMNEIIDLREQYGAFRRNARVVPMMSDTLRRPRRTGGLTAYWVGESGAGTQSDKAWDHVNLVAKKLMVLAKVSNEFNEDAAISVVDDLFDEIAYAFSVKEDDAGFNGTGTSSYGGIIGVEASFTNLSGTIANIAGLQVASGNAYSEITLTDFVSLLGKLPLYAYPGAKWYCSATFYHTVMHRLEMAAGGVTANEVANGVPFFRFLGLPVEIAQLMPRTEANSQVCCYLGDMRRAAMLGDRRQVTLATSEHALNAFEQDELAVRGTERIDINVHDVGNADATAANRVPGPLVGLITAAA